MNALNDDAEFSHVLLHDDLSAWTLGARDDEMSVVARGLGKYVELRAKAIERGPAVHSVVASAHVGQWRDYRFRAVVTPVSFEDSGPLGGYCGIFVRQRHAHDFIALVLDKNYQVKLLRRTDAGFQLLASAPLEFCIGQSLTLTLTVQGSRVRGSARPYSGETKIEATLGDAADGVDGTCGAPGFISAGHSRFGPHTAECSPAEAERIAKAAASYVEALKKKRDRFPGMKIEKRVPLRGLASGPNVVMMDINGDGKLEIIAAQSSKKIAAALSLTRLTCLTALDLDGNILWQAGVLDPESGGEDPVETAHAGALPFQVVDLFGDGHPVVVCAFGYDLQIRDAKTGRVMMSAGTPGTAQVSDEFKAVTSSFGMPWGDETLNMTVASIDFCDTQGNGGRREILIKDDYHNLAVLDTTSDPFLHPLFVHRGNLGGAPWIGDIDGDGKDEILCGYSLLDDNGKLLANLALGGYARSVNVFGLETPGEARVVICAGESGLIVLDLEALKAGRYAGEIPGSARVRGIAPDAIHAGKFRPELPGEQYAVMQIARGDAGSQGGRFALYDNAFNLIYAHDLFWDMGTGPIVNWTKDGSALIILSNAMGGLDDGINQMDMTPEAYDHCAVLKGYQPNGCDAVLGIKTNELQICVPDV